MVEYYSGDYLRWGFGLDNPNKAAAVLAALIPLVWGIAKLFSGRGGWRWLCRVLLWFVVLALAVGLLGTFSRGGIIAAIAGLAWMFVGAKRLAGTTSVSSGVKGGLSGVGLQRTTADEPRSSNYVVACTEVVRPKIRFRGGWAVVGISALVGLAGAAWRMGIFDRFAGIGSDASVWNRLELWKAGLAMVWDMPQGWGGGNAGSAFMEWYQPLGSDEGYRTMVNAPLTLLVEHGLWRFTLGASLAGGLFAWAGGIPGYTVLSNRKHMQRLQWESLRCGTAGSLVASLVAGLFTTTWEERWVLGATGLAAGILLAGRAGRLWPGSGLKGVGAMVTVCASVPLSLVLGVGLAFPWSDGLEREFHDGEVGLYVRPTGADIRAAPKFVMVPDRAVTGERPGRIARELALGCGATVGVVLDPKKLAEVEALRVVMLCGERVWGAAIAVPGDARVFFLAPASPNGAGDELVLHPGEIWIPEIEEDGRTSWWRTEGARLGVPVQDLPGVGTRIDWAVGAMGGWLRMKAEQ